MKRLSVVGAIITSFLLGAAMTVVAQDENKQDEHKNDKKEAAQPPARQEQAKPEEHRNHEPQNEERRQEPRQDERQMKQQEEQQKKMDKQQEKMEKQQGREQERHEQARPEQRQGEQARAERHEGNHRRIPDADFHAHFGREHHFMPGRVQVYGGRPQFNYGGYVFELVEPWPGDWAYDDDDYYIDYVGDEYWLYSLRYPGVRLELIIIG